MTDERPPAEAAPPATVTLKCGSPGCPNTWEWEPRGGRKPKYCPQVHRRSANAERSEIAYHARKRMAADLTKEQADARAASQAARLAAGLRITEDPETAAKLFGVDARGDELAALVIKARKEHERLIAGDMRDTAHLAEATIHVLLLEGIERRGEMSPRDRAMVGRFALDVREAFIGDGVQTNYVSINLTVVPPPADGKLTDEQLAKVRGTAVIAPNPREGDDEN